MPLKRKQPVMDERDAPGLGPLVACESGMPPAKLASSPALKQSPGLRQTATLSAPPKSARADAHGSAGPPAQPTFGGLQKLPSLSAMFGPFDPPHPSPQSHASSSPTQSLWNAPHDASRLSPGSSPITTRSPHGLLGSGSSSSSGGNSSPSQAPSWATSVDEVQASAWSHGGGSGSSYRGSFDDGFNPTPFLPGLFVGPPNPGASAQPAQPQPLLRPFPPPAAATPPLSTSPVLGRLPAPGYAQHPSALAPSPIPAGPPPAPGVPPHLNVSRKAAGLGLDFADFDILDTLGTGTFGRVLLVRLRRDGRHFAMKVLVKTEVVRLSQVEHINSERAILGAVRHPGIVNLCVARIVNLYIVLEFVQGGELFSHLRRAGRFTADVARFYAANIILAIEHMHARDIVYRDLKPENLLLDSMARLRSIGRELTAQGYVKLTDLGFSKYVPDRTFTLCGTPSFLSPEIITGTGHGKPADWWAFGVCSADSTRRFAMSALTCSPPFYDDNPLLIYEQIMAGRVLFPPHVDAIAKDLIKRLLTADLSRRLGNLRGGVADIKRHPWFEGVSWGAVARREIGAPIVPRTSSSGDTVHFDRHPPTSLEALPGFAAALRARDPTLSFNYALPSPDADIHASSFLAF